MLWYVVNRCCDVSVFEKLPFHPSTRQHENGVFKKVHCGERFRKASFFGDRKRRLRVDANPKRIKKDAFSKICRSFLDMKGFAGAILMDLSKAFDFLNHELLIAKLEAYGFSRSALKLVYDYLSNRKQRVKINGSFSSWQESIKCVSQGSVVGPLLFNVFINDLFFLVEETEICNYADDTTIYVCGHKLEHIVSSLKTDAQRLSKWFLDNSMKLNPDKCHPLVFGLVQALQ